MVKKIFTVQFELDQDPNLVCNNCRRVKSGRGCVIRVRPSNSILGIDDRWVQSRDSVVVAGSWLRASRCRRRATLRRGGASGLRPRFSVHRRRWEVRWGKLRSGGRSIVDDSRRLGWRRQRWGRTWASIAPSVTLIGFAARTERRCCVAGLSLCSRLSRHRRSRRRGYSRSQTRSESLRVPPTWMPRSIFWVLFGFSSFCQQACRRQGVDFRFSFFYRQICRRQKMEFRVFKRNCRQGVAGRRKGLGFQCFADQIVAGKGGFWNFSDQNLGFLNIFLFR